MRTLLTGLFLCCLQLAAQAQSTLRARVANAAGEPLPGATLQWLQGSRTIAADSNGLLLLTGIPDGTQQFTLSFVGYEAQHLTLTFPLDSLLQIRLAETEEDEEETIVVSATRTSRSIANTPTRTEVISGEELAEKGNMKPGDIRMLLSESTGIQTQQTSATSYNAGIRIQGLDGRYTQVLRDGYPLYAGFSGGLSILQIAPLDLRQVEVIKGSASTLYGGGAIAGLVNLVSKTPGKARELSFLLNATSAGGFDASGYYSQRYGHAGLTVYAARNSTAPYDPAGIGFTAIPKSERYTVNPRLFLYGKRTTADIGVSYIGEDRTGGNITTVREGGLGFFERNETGRVTTQLGIAHRLSDHSQLQFKNSFSVFDRVISIPGYRFDARQQSGFSELTWNWHNERVQWVTGANFLSDALRERKPSGTALDYGLQTFGLFVQNAWQLNGRLTFESGLRGDYVSNGYGFELMPRVSALYRISTNLVTRLGGGLGYKTPTVFTEEAERIQLRAVLPIDAAATKNERSAGLNWDLHYRAQLGRLGVSVNTLLFYTRLNGPLLPTETAGGIAFLNAAGHFDSKGTEINARLTYGNFKLFLGYTYTDANTHFGVSRSPLPLTAKHRLNNVLMWEVEEKWKLGLEAYYFSRQLLSDGDSGRPYWITGFMAERSWKHIGVFVNFENFTDTRQTRFGPLYTGTMESPQFKDIYAPVEGFVVNGGVKLRL
ncbi:TonB-dependent receptor [Flaviaesturariibacter aridisoli]|uniref:TonB-dependent receptor n=1 Tax=Flaviaesturariibacter aridisoli TaxID=2545761 RepID=A0A4R4DV49_9BACT|nr:TonB-dependent receptor [Flaviaesturariibacter aridisoli]TCZ67201.1 TonB-dependent receptor [Flaviaesturariibacter aridisoli]